MGKTSEESLPADRITATGTVIPGELCDGRRYLPQSIKDKLQIQTQLLRLQREQIFKWMNNNGKTRNAGNLALSAHDAPQTPGLSQQSIKTEETFLDHPTQMQDDMQLSPNDTPHQPSSRAKGPGPFNDTARAPDFWNGNDMVHAENQGSMLSRNGTGASHVQNGLQPQLVYRPNQANNLTRHSSAPFGRYMGAEATKAHSVINQMEHSCSDPSSNSIGATRMDDSKHSQLSSHFCPASDAFHLNGNQAGQGASTYQSTTYLQTPTRPASGLPELNNFNPNQMAYQVNQYNTASSNNVAGPSYPAHGFTIERNRGGNGVEAVKSPHQQSAIQGNAFDTLSHCVENDVHRPVIPAFSPQNHPFVQQPSTNSTNVQHQANLTGHFEDKVRSLRLNTDEARLLQDIYLFYERSCNSGDVEAKNLAGIAINDFKKGSSQTGTSTTPGLSGLSAAIVNPTGQMNGQARLDDLMAPPNNFWIEPNSQGRMIQAPAANNMTSTQNGAPLLLVTSEERKQIGSYLLKKFDDTKQQESLGEEEIDFLRRHYSKLFEAMITNDRAKENAIGHMIHSFIVNTRVARYIAAQQTNNPPPAVTPVVRDSSQGVDSMEPQRELSKGASQY